MKKQGVYHVNGSVNRVQGLIEKPEGRRRSRRVRGMPECVSPLPPTHRWIESGRTAYVLHFSLESSVLTSLFRLALLSLLL